MASVLKFDEWQNSAGAKFGTVVQTVSTLYTGAFGISLGSTPADVGGFSAVITPKSASNKILVMVTAVIGGDNDTYPYILLKRNGTVIGNGASNGISGTPIFAGAFFTALGGTVQYTTKTVANNLLDSPSTTSAVTYQIAMASPYLGSAYLNRQATQISGASYTQFPASSITLLEIQA